MSINSKQPSADGDKSNEEVTGFVSKRIRLSEPDTQITIGSGDNVKVYHYHAEVISHLSEYIDTVLASDFKEAQTKELTFPEIDPNTWELMINSLTDPLVARVLTPDGAFNLVDLYDKYGFCKGLQLCDQLLSDLLTALITKEEGHKLKPVDDLDKIVAWVAKSHDIGLPKTKKAGLRWLGNRFLPEGVDNQRYGRNIFTVEHIEALAPLISKEKDRFADFKNFSEGEILSPLFARLVVMSIKDSYNQNEHRVAAVVLKYCWRGKEIRTTLRPDRSLARVWYADHGPSHLARWGEWVFVEEISTGHHSYQRILLRCKHSQAYVLPPKKGWEVVDDEVDGPVELSYKVDIRKPHDSHHRRSG